jgi:hypothetical protein
MLVTFREIAIITDKAISGFIKGGVFVPGKFSLRKFSEINLDDPFFATLKSDYPGSASSPSFCVWFKNKAQEGRTALVFSDDQGLGAFICIKNENEPIELKGGTLAACNRVKISTMKIAERFRGQRLGEGAIGLVLWKWQKSRTDEIYVTAFDKQDLLISQLEKFGFHKAGYNLNGEGVYIKSRHNIDYSDPYKSFPFINPNFHSSGYLIINDTYHDTMFPYSELKNNTLQNAVAMNVSNGLSKVYVGAQYSQLPYGIGDPILIYRRYTAGSGKQYRSCITSFCVVTKIIQAKKSGQKLMSFDELLTKIGNKSVFNKDELRNRYNNDWNVLVMEMLYYGYFGEGNNVNMAWLKQSGYWGDGYPTSFSLGQAAFKSILKKGNIDVSNVIID